MTAKRGRRAFDIDMPDTAPTPRATLIGEPRRGPMATAVRESAEAVQARADTEAAVRAENDRLAQVCGWAAITAAGLLMPDGKPRRLYGEAGLLTERLVAAQEVQRLDPDHRDAIWVEIDSLRLLGQRDDAYAKARDFYDRFPDDPDAAGAVVDLMVATGQDEDTIIAFVDQAAEDHTDVVSVHQLQARVYGLFGRIEEARAAALRVAEMDQPDSSTLAATIQLLDVLGETDTVESLLERESDDGDGSDMATVVAASRAWKDARLIDAVRRLEASNRPVEDSSADLLGTLLSHNSSLKSSKISKST